MARITLRDYLDSTQCPDDLKDLMELLSEQAVPIRDAFITNQDYVDSENVSGEKQAELDVWSDEHITQVLSGSKLVKQLASEEKEEILTFEDAQSDYSVVMDPLDGSSLIKVNLAVGTIIGIYEGDALQKGRNMRAAMYMLYGPMTVLTLTVKEGVHIFAMDDSGEYVLLRKDVKIPEGNIYGIGGLKEKWTDEHAEFIRQVENEGYKLRYSGSFVADSHLVLHNGGFFTYPALKGKPDGKLRLVFEANPIGFIISQAGGRCSNGKQSYLDIEPGEAHQRTPIYVGSKKIIERLEGSGR